MSVEHINPEGLFSLPAVSQVVTADTGGRIACIAGQGAFDADFKIVGDGDVGAQTKQALEKPEKINKAVKDAKTANGEEQYAEVGTRPNC